MAQIKRRNRRNRLSEKLAGVAKPGVAALLVSGLVAGGALGMSQTGLSGGFTVSTEHEAQEEPEGDGSNLNDVADIGEIVYIVHVDGAVKIPGVYELTGSDLRIRDAVDAAGGLLENADTSGVNLAAPMVDGSKVHIPTTEEVESLSQYGASGTSSSGGSAALVNINSANAEQLCTLSGIGEATAANIIADREQNGPFTCIEDLMRVSGIGERKFERVKDRICV